MAPRASVDNCAAGAEAAAASKIAGIENLSKAFKESILHSCDHGYVHRREPVRTLNHFQRSTYAPSTANRAATVSFPFYA
jgi:hypothetical protein